MKARWYISKYQALAKASRDFAGKNIYFAVSKMDVESTSYEIVRIIMRRRGYMRQIQTHLAKFSDQRLVMSLNQEVSD